MLAGLTSGGGADRRTVIAESGDDLACHPLAVRAGVCRRRYGAPGNGPVVPPLRDRPPASPPANQADCQRRLTHAGGRRSSDRTPTGRNPPEPPLAATIERVQGTDTLQARSNELPLRMTRWARPGWRPPISQQPCRSQSDGYRSRHPPFRPSPSVMMSAGSGMAGLSRHGEHTGARVSMSTAEAQPTRPLVSFLCPRWARQGTSETGNGHQTGTYNVTGT